MPLWQRMKSPHYLAMVVIRGSCGKLEEHHVKNAWDHDLMNMRVREALVACPVPPEHGVFPLMFQGRLDELEVFMEPFIAELREALMIDVVKVRAKQLGTLLPRVIEGTFDDHASCSPPLTASRGPEGAGRGQDHWPE